MSAVGSAIAAGESTWSAASAGIDAARTAIPSPCIFFIVFSSQDAPNRQQHPSAGHAKWALSNPPVGRYRKRYERTAAIGSDRNPILVRLPDQASHGASATLVPTAQP